MKGIMIQGCSSSVGKTVITIGLCRLLTRMGYKVAPFKPQNLTSNVHHLGDNKQMARSQALAAYACGLKPDPLMNPVLISFLQATVEMRINGLVSEHWNLSNYGSNKKILLEEVCKSYRQLSKDYDIIVVEGAGSPVEMNLKQDDISNMGFATAVQIPVILVGDIHRGGIFASLYGTLGLMEANEKDLVKGVIVNKFRGDPIQFGEGKEVMEHLTQRPVLGVLPWLSLDLEEEDSLDQLPRNNQGFPTTVPSDSPQYRTHLNTQFDQLADWLERYLDMEKIQEILGL